MKSKFNFGDLDKLNYNDINTFNQKLGEDGFDPKDFFDENEYYSESSIE